MWRSSLGVVTLGLPDLGRSAVEFVRRRKRSARTSFAYSSVSVQFLSLEYLTVKIQELYLWFGAKSGHASDWQKTRLMQRKVFFLVKLIIWNTTSHALMFFALFCFWFFIRNNTRQPDILKLPLVGWLKCYWTELNRSELNWICARPTLCLCSLQFTVCKAHRTQ